MKKYYALYGVLICLTFCSCTFSTTSSSKTPEFTNIPQTISPQINHSFVSSYWQIVDQPNIVGSKFSIRVYAMKLSGNNTLIICSNTNDFSTLFDQPNTIIQLRDNIGHTTLLSKSQLYSINNVDFWILNFDARSPNSTEIYLFIADSKGSIYFEGQIAKLIGSIEDQDVFRLRTMMIATSQTFEQDDYRITFYGWTPPPIPITPNPSVVPENITTNENATLSIENNSTQIINYLAIQFLSNGQITSELIK